MKKGFTLIELLVVVLIIGILAAIALPQYQRAVAKARTSEAMQMVRSVKHAIERHRLASGGVNAKFSVLDISLPDFFACDEHDTTCQSDKYKYQIYPGGGSSPTYYIFGEVKGTAITIESNTSNQKMWCNAGISNATANRVCASLTGSGIDHSKETWNYYRF